MSRARIWLSVLVLVGLGLELAGCIPCGGADECCDANGTVLPNAPSYLCRPGR